MNKLSGGIYFRRAGPREKVLYLSLCVCAPVLSVAGIVALPRSANWNHKKKGPSFQDFLIQVGSSWHQKFMEDVYRMRENQTLEISPTLTPSL